MTFNNDEMRFETTSTREDLLLAAGFLVSPGFAWLAVRLIHWFLD